MKQTLISLLLSCLILPLSTPAQETVDKVEFSLENGNDRYELRATMRWATSDLFGPNTIVMRFSVYRNGEFLHPRSVDGGILFGGEHGHSRPASESVTIRPLEDIGWIVSMGAIRGNTNSDTYTLIIPFASLNKWVYLQESFTAKYDPIIRRNGDKIEI